MPIYCRSSSGTCSRSRVADRYATVVADPPWRYRKDGRDRVGDRTYGAGVLRWAEQNYRTMSNAEIQAIPVREWVAADACLFLWVTSPRMYGERSDRSIDPADIMAAWGFTYTTTLVWEKLGAPGLGNYFRVDTEFCLFGVRGSVRIAPAMRESNVIRAPRTSHSTKPDAFYELVERVTPEPRLEMFARRRRYGWDVWGDQAPTEAASQAVLGIGG